MCNKCMRSGGGGIPGEGLGTSFVSAKGSKLVVRDGSIGSTMVLY